MEFLATNIIAERTKRKKKVESYEDNIAGAHSKVPFKSNLNLLKRIASSDTNESSCVN